ncbi:MAG: hypothetical protein AAFY28_11025, partial [Actinomycetota bacterium]
AAMPMVVGSKPRTAPPRSRISSMIAVFTEWPEFAKLDLARLAAVAGATTTIVDTRNLLDPDEVRAAGLDYDGVGRR